MERLPSTSLLWVTLSLVLLRWNMSRLSSVSSPSLFPCTLANIICRGRATPLSRRLETPKDETDLSTLGAMILQLYPAAGEVLPEGLLITTNTLKLAFGGYDPLTGLLAHIV